MNHTSKIRIQVVGPFRVIGPNGENLTPHQKRSCALLAMLTVANGYRHARTFLQDKLWSRSAHEQSGSSLRQSLSDIKRCLKPHENILVTEAGVVMLRSDRILIDTCAGDEPGLAQATEFLEGLDIRNEPEFEDWLRQQRSAFRNRHNSPPLYTEIVSVQPAQPLLRAHRPFRLVLVDGAAASDPAATWRANSLINMAAESARELGVADVFDLRGVDSLSGSALSSDPTVAGAQLEDSVALKADVAVACDHHLFRFELSRLATRQIIWSSVLEIDASKPPVRHHPEFLQAINHMLGVILAEFGAAEDALVSDASAATLCIAGIRRLFMLGAENFAIADRCFAAAHARSPRGLYLAWRAYLRTFMLAERQYNCRATLIEEALAFKRQALEREPHNSFVLALSAHVETIITRSYGVAFELAERSIEANAANAIGWASLGIARCHLDEPQAGFRDTLMARRIAGSAVYRYQLDALGCIAGTMAGEFEMARRCAEASHAAAPRFAPPLRYLCGLYLEAGDLEASQQMVELLCENEPGFSYDWLLEGEYPAAGLRRSGLMTLLPCQEI